METKYRSVTLFAAAIAVVSVGVCALSVAPPPPPPPSSPCTVSCADGAGLVMPFDPTNGINLNSLSLTFNVPGAMFYNSSQAAVTSTIYSAVAIAYGKDTYTSLATVQFDVTEGTWAVQALIQQNGVTVVSGDKHYTSYQPHTITCQAVMPAGVNEFMQLTIQDPYSGLSQAVMGGFTQATATTAWAMGWGWNASLPDALCADLPHGGVAQISEIYGFDSNGNAIGFGNFTRQTEPQSFCGLAAGVQNVGAEGTVTISFTD